MPGSGGFSRTPDNTERRATQPFSSMQFRNLLPQSEVVKLLPPLTITTEELDEGLRTLARCVRETA
ncbi:hypothetical protein SMICM304S_07956 [Streptomyces microflavus]